MSLEEQLVQYTEDNYDPSIGIHDFILGFASQSVQQALAEAEEAKWEIIEEYNADIIRCQVAIDYSSNLKEVIEAKAKSKAFEGFIKELKSIKYSPITE